MSSSTGHRFAPALGRREPPAAAGPFVLAGGASTRLGADKPEQRVGGRRLLDIALAAVADADTVVVVGPPRDVPTGVTVVCEEPPGRGPVAALAAGFAALPDTVRPTSWCCPPTCRGSPPTAVTALATARGDAPVALAGDDDGHRQYLTAVWDSVALAAALTAYPSRMRDLLPGNAVTCQLGDVDDVDTPEQLAAAQARADRTPDAVRDVVRGAIGPIPAVERGLDAAVGAALAEPLTATTPFPPFDASAMDGWAVAGPWSVDPSG